MFHVKHGKNNEIVAKNREKTAGDDKKASNLIKCMKNR